MKVYTIGATPPQLDHTRTEEGYVLNETVTLQMPKDFVQFAIEAFRGSWPDDVPRVTVDGVYCTAGTTWDGASVPAVLKPLASNYNCVAIQALRHDIAYRIMRAIVVARGPWWKFWHTALLRRRVDCAFYSDIKAANESRGWIYWAGVRLGGWIPWRR